VNTARLESPSKITLAAEAAEAAEKFPGNLGDLCELGG